MNTRSQQHQKSFYIKFIVDTCRRHIDSFVCNLWAAGHPLGTKLLNFFLFSFSVFRAEHIGHCFVVSPFQFIEIWMVSLRFRRIDAFMCDWLWIDDIPINWSTTVVAVVLVIQLFYRLIVALVLCAFSIARSSKQFQISNWATCMQSYSMCYSQNATNEVAASSPNKWKFKLNVESHCIDKWMFMNIECVAYHPTPPKSTEFYLWDWEQRQIEFIILLEMTFNRRRRHRAESILVRIIVSFRNGVELVFISWRSAV